MSHITEYHIYISYFLPDRVAHYQVDLALPEIELTNKNAGNLGQMTISHLLSRRSMGFAGGTLSATKYQVSSMNCLHQLRKIIRGC